MPKKSFNAPFWIVLVIAVILFAWYFNIYLEIKQVNEESVPSKRIQFNPFFVWLWPALLLGEAIVYRAIRKKIEKRVFVWVHIFNLVLAFLLIPLIPPVMGFLAEKFSLVPLSAFKVYDRVKPPVTLAILILGHAFFIATIAKSFTKKDISAADDEQTTGILTGIIDEH